MADEELSIKIRNLVQGAQEVERLAGHYDRLDRQTRRDFNDPTDRLDRGVRRTRTAVVGLTSAFTALGGAIAFRELIQATNQYRQLEGQLNTVTRSQEETNQRFKDLHGIANDTFASLDSTVQLYARVTRATEELGNATDAQVLRFTKVVNQAIAASGASMTEASAATTQLTQGLASGIFRAEEFNSVLEQTPRLAQAIADGLGVTIGQLRQMLLDGELTSERVFQAILDQTGAIEEEFNSLPQRVDQALTQLGNDLTAAFGKADVTALVEAIDEFREVVTDEQFVNAVTNLAENVFDFLRGGAELFGQINREIQTYNEGVARFEATSALNDQVEKVERLTNQYKRLKAELGPGFDRDQPISVAGGKTLNELEEELRLELEILKSRRKQRQLVLAQQRDQENDEAADTAGAGAGTGAGGGGPADIDIDQSGAPGFRARDNRGGRFSGNAAERAAAIYERTRTAAERYQQAVGELEQLHEMGLITQETYNRALEEQKEKLKEAGDQAEETGEEISEFAKQAKRNIETQLGETLRRTLTGNFDDIEDAWRQMIFQMATEAAAANLSEALFGEGEGFSGGIIGSVLDALGNSSGGTSSSGGSGGGDGWVSTVASFVASLFHGGRSAGSGGTHAQRNVNPAVFANAPRLHNGIRSDEIPAIIQKSEDVVTQDSPRHSRNFQDTINQAVAGAKPQMNLRNINVLDPADIREALNNPEGDEVIVNAVGRNPDAVKGAIS